MDSVSKNANREQQPASDPGQHSSESPRPRGRSGFTSVLARAVHEANLGELSARLLRQTHADGIAIALSDGEKVICRASQGLAPEPGVVIEKGSGLCGTCLESGQVVLEQQIEGEIQSVAAIPIRSNDEVYGCVAAFSLAAGAFNETDIAELVETADRLGRYERPAPVIDPVSEYIPELPALPEDFTTGDEDLPDDEIAKLIASVTKNGVPVALTDSLESIPQPASPEILEDLRDDKEILSHLDEILGPTAKQPPVAKPPATEIPKPAPAPGPKKERAHADPDLLISIIGPKDAEVPPPATVSSKSESAGVAAAPRRAPEPSRMEAAAEKPKVEIEAEPFTETPSTALSDSARSRYIIVAVIAVMMLIGTGYGIWHYVKTRSAAPPAQTPSASTQPPVQQPNAQTSAAPSTPNQPSTGKETTPKPAQTSPASSAASPKPAPQPIVVDSSTSVKRTAEAPDVAPPSIRVNSEAVNPQIQLPGSTTVPTLSVAARSAYRPARLISSTKPRYPDFARRMKITGAVEMEITVSPEGRVSQIKVVKGEPSLVEAARSAVRQWRYEPAESGGQSVPSQVHVTVDFKAQ